MYTGPKDEEPGTADAELLRQESERRLRAERRDSLSWKILGWVMAAAVALLGYDSGGAAVDAHGAGKPWLYPATVSAICALVLAAIVARALARRR